MLNLLEQFYLESTGISFAERLLSSSINYVLFELLSTDLSSTFALCNMMNVFENLTSDKWTDAMIRCFSDETMGEKSFVHIPDMIYGYKGLNFGCTPTTLVIHPSKTTIFINIHRRLNKIRMNVRHALNKTRRKCIPSRRKYRQLVFTRRHFRFAILNKNTNKLNTLEYFKNYSKSIIFQTFIDEISTYARDDKKLESFAEISYFLHHNTSNSKN